jgi:CheY-like chemotaxis protein
MERQLGQMVHLVDDLLDMARISRGQIELKKERADLGNVVASAVETSLPLIDANRHSLTVHMPDEPLILDIDPTRIAQVISNLLNNAAKYTPAGGRINLTVRPESAEVIIDVTDTGIGISAESLAMVFELFAQVRGSKDRTQGGLGIGLSLVRRLVEMHGGTVSASSPGIGQGSTFTVRLPLSGRGHPPSSTADRDTACPRDATRPLRVLVVDDNTDAAETLATLLTTLRHTTRVASNGDQALELVREFRPDVVFLDLGMPGKDGYDVVRVLRQTAGMERVKLVALTGWGSEIDRARTEEAGFDRHLTKPASLAALQAVLSDLVQPADAPTDRPSC